MIELLSLPRRNHLVVNSSGIKFESGLPINSLPGWEHIPLNCKLPMLKCPDNQVIFSKNKIGKTFKDARHIKHDFDSSGGDTLPEYNSLHDSNLKRFYANERNLKRVRENGEITQNNDVICNLKDFNAYREQLHKAHLYYVLQDLNRIETEVHDRMLINNAEQITNEDHKNLAARSHTLNEIIQRKAQIDRKKAERFRQLLEHTNEKIRYIEYKQFLQHTSIDHKKVLQQLSMQKHWDVRNDIERKRLISLKKLFQFKKDRLEKNLRLLHENRLRLSKEQQYSSWSRRLAERIANQRKIQALLEEEEYQKQIFIENHKKMYHEKWEKIQMEIKKRSKKNHRKFIIKHKSASQKRKLRNAKDEIHPICPKDSMDQYQTDAEVCKALNDIQSKENDARVPFDGDDPIYKAARYIMENILSKYNKDLSDDKYIVVTLCDRVDAFLTDAKKFVMFRATQLISSLRKQQNVPEQPVNEQPVNENVSRVSFNDVLRTIGVSSYSVHPLINVKHVATHKKTPPGSLDSLVVDSTESLAVKNKTSHLNRDDMVFIEHYLSKFKRQLTVGVSRRVFLAIECHFQNKIMNVRQELLDIDRKFLVKQVAKSILSYAKNPLNLESKLHLCISALSSEIIWSLQQELIKPQRDPRRIVTPRFSCDNKHKRTMEMCLRCD